MQHVHCSAVILCCALSGDCVEYLCRLQYVCAVKAVLTLAGRGGHYLSFPRDPITSVSSDRHHLPISGRLPHLHTFAIPEDACLGLAGLFART